MVRRIEIKGPQDLYGKRISASGVVASFRSVGGSSRTHFQSAGFTLIELLAVVGIIALLAALLMGGLGTFRGAAERAKCASNLRAIASGIHLYSTDNNGWLPPGHRPNMGGGFSKVLADYTDPMKSISMAADIFYCPANVRMSSPPAQGYPPNSYKGWSGYFLGYCLNASAFPITSSDIASSGYTPDEEGRRKLLHFNEPSKTVALMDLRTRAPGVSGPPTSTLARAYYFDPTNANYGLGLVHEKMGNILFLDGHVETFTGAAPLPVSSLTNQAKTWWP